MIRQADRLDHVEEYYFSKKLKEVNLMLASGTPVINLGIGSPDLQPPFKVIEALKDSLTDAKAHKYQSYFGIEELREEIAAFYRNKFNVSLSHKTEILPLMGSKEGIMHISMAFLNPGDEVLIPNPGYPTYSAVAKLVQATPRFYNLTAETDWYPNLIALEKENLEKVKLMWISYPHMPTGRPSDFKHLEELVAFAKRNNILLVNDNPYSFILNDTPKSILKIQGAKEHCLELNSLSKTFNMAGWRVGMVLGNQELLTAIAKVKTNMDSGMFYGIQKGAIEALKCSDLWYVSLNSVYEKRRELIWKLATSLNCTFNKEYGGMFVWAKLPDYFTAEEFVEVLLKKYHIFIAPGHIFGSNGEGYVRFSLCAPTEDIEEAIARVE